jgi:hypothetical protein
LLLSSVLLSRQIKHSRSAAAVTAVVAVAVSMAAEAVVALMMVAADLMAAPGLLAEEVTTEAAAFVVDQGRVLTERAAVRTAGLKLAGIPARPEIIRRVIVPQLPMASGILSATPVVPRV